MTRDASRLIPRKQDWLDLGKYEEETQAFALAFAVLGEMRGHCEILVKASSLFDSIAAEFDPASNPRYNQHPQCG
jgi:hypothetical protein